MREYRGLYQVTCPDGTIQELSHSHRACPCLFGSGGDVPVVRFREVFT